MLEGAIIGAILFMIYCAITFPIRKAAIKKYLKIEKGMSYEQVVNILGEPDNKRIKGEMVLCSWKRLAVNGKLFKEIGIQVKNDLVEKVGVT